MKPDRLRIIAVNLAVLGLLALVALGAIEVYLRLTVPASSSESIYEYSLDTRRYKVMKPNARIVAWGKELRTNALGFRDNAERIPPKAPGEVRIIVLGDSMTVSAGVEFTDTYTSLLEARLQRTYPGVRVVNLAVGGYNMLQYALVLEEIGMALDPDLILIGVSADNDFALDTYEDNYRVASGQQPPPALAWHESLYVYQAYLGKVLARVERMLGNGNPDQANAGEAWARNVAALRSILALAERHAVPVAAVVLPQTWHFERQRPVFAQVDALCRQHGLPCLNLLEAFIARGTEEASLRLNPLDSHPNEKYHVVVAQELTPFFAGVLAAKAGNSPSGLPRTSDH